MNRIMNRSVNGAVIRPALLILSLGFIFSGCAQRSAKEVAKEPVDPNKEKIRSGIKTNVSLFQKCFTDHLNRKDPTTGKIVLKWQIKKDGRSNDVGVVFSEFKDKAFNKCMVDAVAKIQFPIIEGGERIAEVQYPFVFAAENKAEVPNGNGGELGNESREESRGDKKVETPNENIEELRNGSRN